MRSKVNLLHYIYFLFNFTFWIFVKITDILDKLDAYIAQQHAIYINILEQRNKSLIKSPSNKPTKTMGKRDFISNTCMVETATFKRCKGTKTKEKELFNLCSLKIQQIYMNIFTIIDSRTGSSSTFNLSKFLLSFLVGFYLLLSGCI